MRTYEGDGFTLVELMVVVLIIGILVAVAVPVLNKSTGAAQKRTCYMNQNTLERAVETYLADNPENVRADLAGLVNAEHPIVMEHIIGHAPHCPAGDKPGDVDHPTVAEGAYVFKVDGTLEPCPQGIFVHGHY